MIKKVFLLMASLLFMAMVVSNGEFDTSLVFAANGASKQQEFSMELVNDIKEKQETLIAREEDLKRREDKVDALEKDLETKIAELRRLQVRLDELIKIRGDVEDTNIAALSKTYSSMKASEAAPRLQAMDRKIALKILSQIKAKKASKIFASMDEKISTEMTEQLARRKLD